MDLLELLHKNQLEAFYEHINYSYAKELEFNKSKSFEENNSFFIKRFSWKTEPTHEIILRIFNQINSYYAENFAMQNPEQEPIFVLTNCNRILLFQQDKRLGFRNSHISFGVRKCYDRFDPINSKQWLYGLAPNFISDFIIKWQYAIDNAKPSCELAIFLTMAFICVHPYSDGNGRLGRIIFTWLCKKWKLKELFLAEASDGEFLRTGENIESTEHIMGVYFLYLCSNFNEVPFLFRESRTEEDFQNAYEAIISKIESAVKDESIILNNDKFKSLMNHFKSNGHIVQYSQRFQSLKDILSINLLN